tara:strand:- start:348 stop:560 length:213 start_codon:yes stop_codon:yes gene_type:complete
MSIIERIKEIEENLQRYKTLFEQLQDMEMIYDNLDWGDVYKPHHIDMELSGAINEVENKINEIESKLEMI